VRVVAAPDKFRSSASAQEIAESIGRAVTSWGGLIDLAPMADGGEGTLEALGGANRTMVVQGPLGESVEAEWRLSGGVAVIEMAQASGLLLAGGAEGNLPLDASTVGTGQLILQAVEQGAEKIIVAVGGSATTDGGLGALEAMGSLARYRGVELLVACDVRTRFVDAAQVFGPQKGASAAQVNLLSRRLNRLAQVYQERFGFDVLALDRAGAAGGLAGGLAAVGGQLVDGADLVADELLLDELLEGADLVVTGEGCLDESSFEGKVVGGVAAYAAAVGVDLLVVAGRIDSKVAGRVAAVSLVEEFGEKTAMAKTGECVEAAVGSYLREHF